MLFNRLTRGFAPKLLVTGVIALFLGLAAAVIWTVIDSHDAAREQALAAEQNVAQGVARDVRRAIDSLDLSLFAAATGMQFPGIADADPLLRQAVLFDGSLKAEGYAGVAVTDESGNVLYRSSGTITAGLNVADRDYFTVLRDEPNRGLVITPPFFTRSGNNTIIALVRRLNHPDGSFAGIVIGGLQVSYLQSLTQHLDLGKLGNVTLANTSGVLIARTPYVPDEIGRALLGSTYSSDLGATEKSVIERKGRIDGIDRLYTYNRVGKYPFIVSVGQATAEIYAGWRQKSLILAGVLVALLLLGAGLVLKLRQELLRRGRAERAATQSELKHAEALTRLNALFQNSNDAMVVARVDGENDFIFEAVNPVWERLIGVPSDVAVGRTPTACLPPAAAAKILGSWRQCKRQCCPATFSNVTVREGEAFYWEVLVVPIFGDTGGIDRIVAVSRDVTQRKAAEDKLTALNQTLAAQANTDGLTGLANRRSLDEGLEREWRRATREGNPLSMLLIDLDRFKGFNDRYGHLAGDNCLREVAKAIAMYAGRPGDIAARYGGEEMAVLLPATGPGQAALLAERVRQAIERTDIEHAENLPFGVVTGSIGVATAWPVKAIILAPPDTLVAAADAALYEAKRTGRNRVVGPTLVDAPVGGDGVAAL